MEPGLPAKNDNAVALKSPGPRYFTGCTRLLDIRAYGFTCPLRATTPATKSATRATAIAPAAMTNNIT